jgi:hypothetical protein
MIKTMRKGEIKLRIFEILLVVLLVLGYGFFRVKDLIAGPVIELASPIDGATVSSPLVEVKGKAFRISLISLNNRQIFTDKNGNFREPLLLADGYNQIEIKAKDKFGRTITKTIRLVKI